MKSSSSSFSANLGTNSLTASILRRGVLRQLTSAQWSVGDYRGQ